MAADVDHAVGDDENETASLNAAGTAGWELVSTEQTARGHRYFFKRAR